MTPPPKPRRLLLLNALLALITLAVYAPVVRHDFILVDDPDYVTENQMVQKGLTAESVAWAFTSTRYFNWFPLTWLSHMLDWQLFGSRAAGHHAMNLLLHTTATLLLFAAMRRLTGADWRSAFVAAMFAWHPVHVESVAWVAERKDVLSAVFWMLTLLAYQSYAERPAPRRYALTLLTFALGLMSKPMVVTLPCVLLLLDFWPLRRLRLPTIPSLSTSEGERAGERGRREPSGTLGAQEIRSVLPSSVPFGQPAAAPVTLAETLATLRRLVVEKLPFFVLTLAASVVTFFAQKEGGAVVPAQALSLGSRLVNSLVAYLDYAHKIFWPAKLAAYYPYTFAHPLWKIATAILFLAGATTLSVRWLRSRPWFLVGWLWYLGTLVPVIGLIQVGGQGMADRYTYIPAVGLGIIIAWGAAALVVQWPAWRLPVWASGWGVLAGCVILTSRQLSYWLNTQTLFEHTVAVTQDNPFAVKMLGEALLTEGGKMLKEQPPRVPEAEERFRQCIALRPDFAKAYHNLGVALGMEGNYDEAFIQLQEAVRLNPADAGSQDSLGMALASKRRFEAALPYFTESLRLNPGFEQALVHRALMFQNLGRFDEAIADWNQVLRLKPAQELALAQLGIALTSVHRFGEAATCFRRLLAIKPQSVEALHRLAWILATVEDPALRNGAEARQLATRACELTRNQDPQSLSALAAACAELGRFDEAVRTAQQALTAAQATGQTGLITRIQSALQLYQAGKPFRESAP